MATSRVIQTWYHGRHFRSRNEARWAIYLDALGLAWQYEPEGYFINGRGYLPDFWLPQLDCFAEVKPGIFTSEEWALCCGLPAGCLLLDGEPAARAWAYIDPLGTGGEPCTYDEYLGGGQYGRIVLSVSKHRGRLWFLLGEDYEDYGWNVYEEQQAVALALSARFEHGERPSTEVANGNSRDSIHMLLATAGAPATA